MNKVSIAAALAVGMMSFAAHAQEAPGNPYTIDNTPLGKTATAANAEKARRIEGTARVEVDRGRSSMVRPDTTMREEKPGERKGRSRVDLDRGEGQLPGVDRQTTASVPKRPDLVAKSRKKEIVTETSTRSGGYGDIIARYASANGVPVSLAHAVVRIESNFRPQARGRAGEVGLMQIKPSTARGLGYSGSTKALYDPETNIKWGMKYLGMAHKLGGGDTCGTILRYNAGHGAKRMNPVSAAYCAKVKRHLAG